MHSFDFYTILNSRLLTILLLFNLALVSILFLISEFPQNLNVVIQERLFQYQSLEDADFLAPPLTEQAPVYGPSPDWLINALNDDDLPCESLPPPTVGQRLGYSYPPSTSPRLQSLQSTYIPFQHQASNPPSPKLSSELDIAEACLDSMLTGGNLCISGVPDIPKLDVVWTFANGSGVLHEKWRKVREVQQRLQRGGTLAPRASIPFRRPVAGTEKKLFRDHDELRHSMRSVLQHFRPHTSQFHLITSDFAFPSCNPDQYAGWRLGQIPQWLDLRSRHRLTDGDIKLNIVPHAKIFNKGYKYTTFNSLAIESQFGNLNVSDAFVYLNDDFYFTADLSPWDFYTPSYGLVLRMQPDLLVTSMADGARPSSGEWHSLEFSNRLLSDRFGSRSRPYVIHEAKAFKRSLIAEISLIWSAELAATASHPFRTDPLLRDAHMGFMAAHFVVERWREGLLWSWIVARLGGSNDEWDRATTDRAWFELGGRSEAPDMLLSVDIPVRDSLSEERLTEARIAISGTESKRSTQYAFSSQDGYPYMFLGKYGMRRWPKTPNPSERCYIRLETCFPSNLTNASDVFKHIAFADPQCGDCMINALVGASGKLGLSAFLPPITHSNKTLKEPAKDSVPHLPLVSDYRIADFSLQGVLGAEADVRTWTLKMLQRYRFVIGDTPSIFAMVRDVSTAIRPFQRLNFDKSIALLCLNDDIGGQVQATDDVLRREQGRRWPNPAAWEKR